MIEPITRGTLLMYVVKPAEGIRLHSKTTHASLTVLSKTQPAHPIDNLCMELSWLDTPKGIDASTLNVHCLDTLKPSQTFTRWRKFYGSDFNQDVLSVVASRLASASDKKRSGLEYCYDCLPKPFRSLTHPNFIATQKSEKHIHVSSALGNLTFLAPTYQIFEEGHVIRAERQDSELVGSSQYLSASLTDGKQYSIDDIHLHGVRDTDLAYALDRGESSDVIRDGKTIKNIVSRINGFTSIHTMVANRSLTPIQRCAELHRALDNLDETGPFITCIEGALRSGYYTRTYLQGFVESALWKGAESGKPFLSNNIDRELASLGRQNFTRQQLLTGLSGLSEAQISNTLVHIAGGEDVSSRQYTLQEFVDAYHFRQ